jgi:hypothetical protein
MCIRDIEDIISNWHMEASDCMRKLFCVYYETQFIGGYSLVLHYY